MPAPRDLPNKFPPHGQKLGYQSPRVGANLGSRITNQFFNPKQVGLFADWYGRGRADSGRFCNFSLNGPIDLKFDI